MKIRKSIADEEAPWRIPRSDGIGSDKSPFKYKRHDEKVYNCFSACNMVEPIPTLISFLKSLSLDTLSKAFWTSKQPIYKEKFNLRHNSMINLMVKMCMMVDFPFW